MFSWLIIFNMYFVEMFILESNLCNFYASFFFMFNISLFSDTWKKNLKKWIVKTMIFVNETRISINLSNLAKDQI